MLLGNWTPGIFRNVRLFLYPPEPAAVPGCRPAAHSKTWPLRIWHGQVFYDFFAHAIEDPPAMGQCLTAFLLHARFILIFKDASEAMFAV